MVSRPLFIGPVVGRHLEAHIAWVHGILRVALPVFCPMRVEGVVRFLLG